MLNKDFFFLITLLDIQVQMIYWQEVALEYSYTKFSAERIEREHLEFTTVGTSLSIQWKWKVLT